MVRCTDLVLFNGGGLISYPPQKDRETVKTKHRMEATNVLVEFYKVMQGILSHPPQRGRAVRRKVLRCATQRGEAG